MENHHQNAIMSEFNLLEKNIFPPPIFHLHRFLQMLLLAAAGRVAALALGGVGSLKCRAHGRATLPPPPPPPLPTPLAF